MRSRFARQKSGLSRPLSFGEGGREKLVFSRGPRECVRRLGKPEALYRKVTFHKEHLDRDQHLDAVLIGPGYPLYAAVDERLNERLADLAGGTAVYLDVAADAPYRLYFFGIAVRSQSSRGDPQTLHAEVIAVREHPDAAGGPKERFTVVPADSLLDLPAHPGAPEAVGAIDPAPGSDYLKGGFQMELRFRCQEERRQFVKVSRDYLERSFDARIRAAQDRVMALRAREAGSPEVTLARERAEHDYADLQRVRQERLAGPDGLTIAKPGPVRHLATALVLPSGAPPAPTAA